MQHQQSLREGITLLEDAITAGHFGHIDRIWGDVTPLEIPEGRAKAPEGIAGGMLAVMQTQHPSLVTACSGLTPDRLNNGKNEFPVSGFSCESGQGKLLALYNPDLTGQRSVTRRPAGYDDFAPKGRLGLQALTASIDPMSPSHNELALVFRSMKSFSTNCAESFVVLRLQRDGRNVVSQWGLVVNPGAALDLALGLGRNEVGLGLEMAGLDLDGHLFPGAWEFVASRLGILENYLYDVADVLNNSR